jgi:oligoendopeptidase F
MDLLPFKSLPPYKARRFVPSNIDLGEWSQIEPLFQNLEARGPNCASVADFEDWLLRMSELNASLDEEASKRYIAMTCHTEDAEAEKAYLHFVENVQPQIKIGQFKLAQIYAGHALRKALPQHRYEVFDRDTKTQVELFREENVALETEEAKLGQQYQKLTGGLMVRFQGAEKTLVQMGRYLEETERPLRQEAWELVARRRLQEAARFEDTFDELVRLRTQMAKNAGFDNYRDYAFRKLGRFDYTPEDCHNFHEAVELEVVPLMRQLHAERKQQLGLDDLRPWDLSVDVLSRPPLRPFDRVDEMVTRSREIFEELDPELGAGFGRMQELRLLDLANRKGKAPGGYQSTLAESRLPFIFMNAVGIQRDVETILHEAGHAFHALATREEDLFLYRNPPIEICEVASMSMELLGNQYIEKFYAAPEAKRARRTHLETIVTIFPWIATVDAFQHWIYTHPNHTRGERTAAWIELMDRFGGDVDWSGYEAERAHLWHRQLHIFLNAFYYIEYGIAQLGALQVWANAKRAPAPALAAYKEALRLGGSRPLPELFTAAGCKFEFSRKTVAPLLKLVRDELEQMRVA